MWKFSFGLLLFKTFRFTHTTLIDPGKGLRESKTELNRKATRAGRNEASSSSPGRLTHVTDLQLPPARVN